MAPKYNADDKQSFILVRWIEGCESEQYFES